MRACTGGGGIISRMQGAPRQLFVDFFRRSFQAQNPNAVHLYVVNEHNTSRACSSCWVYDDMHRGMKGVTLLDAASPDGRPRPVHALKCCCLCSHHDDALLKIVNRDVSAARCQACLLMQALFGPEHVSRQDLQRTLRAFKKVLPGGVAAGVAAGVDLAAGVHLALPFAAGAGAVGELAAADAVIAAAEQALAARQQQGQGQQQQDDDDDDDDAAVDDDDDDDDDDGEDEDDDDDNE